MGEEPRAGRDGTSGRVGSGRAWGQAGVGKLLSKALPLSLERERIQAVCKSYLNKSVSQSKVFSKNINLML